ncbi:hypothetical protein AVEN_5376-1 [Araneus ventricosus]|uniref:Uncharacterized protein n=1 Tax=Araneus ventricosus TaxID=182803 RepID=A0A4Y2UHL9_ARAVE|nr:hypothetical protein AVEN_5376-1 [Araneus ventricosus]
MNVLIYDILFAPKPSLNVETRHSVPEFHHSTILSVRCRSMKRKLGMDTYVGGLDWIEVLQQTFTDGIGVTGSEWSSVSLLNVWFKMEWLRTAPRYLRGV